MVNADINEYNGNRTVDLKLVDIRFSGFNQDKFFAAESTYEKLCLGEEIPPQLAVRIIPDKKTEMAVYDILKSSSLISACGQIAVKRGINYGMFRVVLDLFKSVGLVNIDYSADKVSLVKLGKKVDLDSCAFMGRLRKLLGVSN